MESRVPFRDPGAPKEYVIGSLRAMTQVDRAVGPKGQLLCVGITTVLSVLHNRLKYVTIII